MCKKTAKIVISVFLVITIIFSSAVFTVAAKVTKTEKTYEIAVVFDNSGSMYDNQSWSRAKYSMEVFAAMLSGRDVLKVYPMHAVTTDGKSKSGGSTNPIVIKSKDDILKIHNLYTPEPLGTPFSTVKNAYNDIKKSSATDKWLIVLTDGAFDNVSQKEVANDFKSQSNDVNVQYIGIGDAKDYSQDSGGKFYAENAKDSANLTKVLTKVCNRIFSRVELPSTAIDKNKINLDISMNKIIVFVQGKDSSIGKLKNSEGTEINEIGGSRYAAKASAISAGKVSGGDDYTDAPVDNSLNGVVVTFDTCKAGEYTLEYSGSIQIFYEPNVDIGITLTNEDGEKVPTNGTEIPSGEYTINYAIIDGENGKDLTNSELLGKDTKLEGSIINSKDEETKVENGAKINLEVDEQTYIKVWGTYLTDYRITTDDNKEAFTFKITDPLQKFELELDRPQKRFTKDKLEEGKPFKVNLTLDGKPLTKEELESADIKVTVGDKENPIGYSVKKLSDKSAVEIKLEYPEGGAEKLNCTDYKIAVSATMKDKENRQLTASCEGDFTVKPFDQWVETLIKLAIVSFVVLLLLFILTRKVFPKNIIVSQTEYFNIGFVKVNDTAKARLRRKDKLLDINSPNFKGDYISISLKVLPVDMLGATLFKPGKRRVKVVGVGASSNCTYLSIDGVDYEKTDKGWILSADADIDEGANTQINQIMHNAQSVDISGKTIKGKKINLGFSLKHK